MGTFQERLKSLRKEKDITIEKLAEDLGSAKSTISRYENGLREPKKDFLEMLSNYFDVSMDYLLGNTDIRRIESVRGYLNYCGDVSDDENENHSIARDSNLDKYLYIDLDTESINNLTTYMVNKIDNLYISKQAFIYLFSLLESVKLINNKNDINLFELRNEILHAPNYARELLSLLDNPPEYK